jgi:hypothetical protein
LTRISFIAFSMGGLICRAAFPLLINLKDKFYTFMTLGSPHLGYMYKSTKLMNTGMWFFNMYKKAESLN